jgi:tRNA1Val (adenine37-N6)-methyltransferase
MMTIRSDETLDPILGGALSVVQPRDGHRFSVDSILLARFATIRSRDRVLELGAGCGVISMVITAIARPRETIALEIQPRMAQLTARNARDNGFPNLHCQCADIRAAHIPGVHQGSFDLVVCNPPFHARGAGRQSPNRSRRARSRRHRRVPGRIRRGGAPLRAQLLEESRPSSPPRAAPN